ncbi:hypothetical protein BU24DRAFT_320413, partial [Aaosphaeria arxii CBS 175.79]
LLVASAAAAPLASAPMKRQEPGNTTTPTGGNKLITVIVGGPQDTFIPNKVNAAPGDIIQFQFSNGNHTVTQSTATDACKPLAGGVHSGHIPFQDGQQTVGTFNMLVPSSDTMFLYCATGPHCQNGQVMIVNPANDQQILDYTKLAAASGESVDGAEARGGIISELPLANAAFTPAPPEEVSSTPAAPPASPAEAAPPAP